MARHIDSYMRNAIEHSGIIESVVTLTDVTGTMLYTTDETVREGTGVPRTDFHEYRGKFPRLSDVEISIIDGSITTDDTSAIPGAGTATLLVPEELRDLLIPERSSSLLAPTNDVRIQIGYRAKGGQITPYGRYDLADAVFETSGAGTIATLEFFDNARRVERASFFRPTKFGPFNQYISVFEAIIGHIVPEATIVVDPLPKGGGKVGKIQTDVQDDRLHLVNNLAKLIGYRIDWNYRGVGDIHVWPEPDGDDTPVWEFVDGENALVVGASRRITDERSYNGVIAMGEGGNLDKPPVRAEAWDTNPWSPTYFDPAKPERSSYGPVPYFMISPFIYKKSQAVSAARKQLPKVMGALERLVVQTTFNPVIEVADTVQIERPEVGASGLYVIEATNRVPLMVQNGTMELVCRERRLPRD